MRKIYKIITFLLCVSIIVLNTTSNCYATTNNSAAVISSYKSLYEQIQSDLDENNPIQGNVLRQFVDYNYTYGMGFLIDYNENILSDILSSIRGYSSGGHDFTLPENATDEEVIESAAEYLTNNISVSDNSITYNDNSRNMLLYLADQFADNSRSYVYSLSLRDVSGLLTTQQYLLAQDIMAGDNSGSEFVDSVWMLQFPSSGYKYLARISLIEYPYLIFRVPSVSNAPNEYNLVNAVPIDAYTGSIINTFDAYQWNTSNGGEWTHLGDTDFNMNTSRKVGIVPNCQRGSDRNIYINIKSTQYRCHIGESSISASEVLYQPYYYNNDVYTSFSNSSGDYVVDSSNINTVTYGDTISYVDSYNTENGNPPSTINVNYYITQQNEQNTNTGGGSGDNGGGSGGDNSGGGSGSGDTNIFDWLKTLGAALGNLIKGVGEFLSEIIAGLVDAVTNLLQAISTLISGVLESLTNIFSGLIEFIYAGLPDDIRNILSLALVVAILITVLKLIRGN